MSPVGDAFRRRCRMFPSLVNCTTIDWFSNWPTEALYSVALGLLAKNTETPEECQALATTTVFMHKTVEDASLRFYKEMKRHYYTTPSSYLELLKLYQSLLKAKTQDLVNKRKRIANGLNKILETNEIVSKTFPRGVFFPLSCLIIFSDRCHAKRIGGHGAPTG